MYAGFRGTTSANGSVVVELVARNPVRVVRNALSILTFDAEGRLDPSTWEKQQFALAEAVVARVFRAFDDDSEQGVVDVTSRFFARDAIGFRHALWRALKLTRKNGRLSF